MYAASSQRDYKERQVDRKKRKAILSVICQHSSVFVMGAMFLASALNRGSHPPEILKNGY